MNIIELNEELSSAFKDLKAGKIDVKTAQAMVNIGNAMTNNAKLMLQAAKVAENPRLATILIGNEKMKEIENADVYTLKTEFAMKLGYQNLSEAVSKMGTHQFNQEFQRNEGL